ncbi:MAG: type II toxin-antitoxin system RelB/DinJ family antitoxin [bacterium]|nr:type II toxin-antitoxin system RelB/DinJ family antitoxin [bacterium]
MASGRIQTRIDPNLQEEAETYLEAQGIKPTWAITMFYIEVKKRKGFPFLPSPAECSGIPNNELAKDLREAEMGIGVKTYKNTEEFFDALDKL